jgi:hypothetical protein
LELFGVGGPREWNFSELSADFQQNRPFLAPDAEFPAAEMMREEGSNARGYYRTNGERFELVGYVGISPIGIDISIATAFEPPYVDRWNPLGFIDNHSTSSSFEAAVGADALPQELLDLIPFDLDSLRIKTDIDRQDLVDAYGSLKLPDGLTYEVLREKRTEVRDVKIEAKINPLPWTDVTPIILQLFPDLAGIALDTALSYTFWSKDAVTPLAKVMIAADGSTIESVEFRNHPLAAPVIGGLPDAFRWQAYPNPAAGPMQLELEGLPAGAYEVELRNTIGQLIYRRSLVSGTLAEQLSLTLAAPQPGVYLLQLRDEAAQVLAVHRLVFAQ